MIVHTAECDWPEFELCTCGEQRKEYARLHDLAREESALEQRETKEMYMRLNRHRLIVKLAGEALLLVCCVFFPWVGIPVASVWVAGMSFLWSMEGYFPLYGDHSIRGLYGYMKWVFF